MGGGSSKGGSADSSGMYTALVSAQAAQDSYQLGKDQLQWTKDVWNAEQPAINQIIQGDITGQKTANQFAQEQSDLYQGTYVPLQKEYAQEAQQWASPAQQGLNAAAAMTNVNEQSEKARQTSTEQLESFGVNPGATRFAGLDIGSRTMQAAASAGAGTKAVQDTKLQGLGLEAGAINTGQGQPNNASSLTSSGTGAGSGGSQAAQSNLATGSSAQTSASNWYNTGASNMNTYVNAVNGYNQAQLGYSQVGASQSAGFGSLAGSILGMLAAGGPTDPNTYGGAIPPAGNGGMNTNTPGVTANSPSAIPPHGTPGGHVPSSASPSGGAAVDDVPARLTVGEFVMPKDIVDWKGQEHFYKTIDKFRQEAAQAKARTDIGGEHGQAIPAAPTFVSRPKAA